ncbi:MAG: hypothetical protein IT232_06710 [Flavobacteriales bacterium]|nr:hypothetical protein [Flavobacteriales bacterium]
MRKNTSFNLLIGFAFLCSTVANAQNSQKTELKPVTKPIEKSSPKWTATTAPSSKTGTKNVVHGKPGIHSNQLIGEGQYLNFDKVIINRSVSGEIPNGFPKHKIGQTKKEYIAVMKKWGAEHPELFKPESHYLDFDKTIKAMTVNGEIPTGFPKYINLQTRKQYIKTMKDWSKANLSLFKPEYWSTINK